VRLGRRQGTASALEMAAKTSPYGGLGGTSFRVYGETQLTDYNCDPASANHKRANPEYGARSSARSQSVVKRKLKTLKKSNGDNAKRDKPTGPGGKKLYSGRGRAGGGTRVRHLAFLQFKEGEINLATTKLVAGGWKITAAKKPVIL